MRLFIAIQFDRKVLSTLTRFQDELKKNAVIGKYTKADNLHLTMAFIGEYKDPVAVLSAMKTVHFNPFEIKLDGYGRFGEIFWAGISGEKELTSLASRIRRALSEAEIPYDKKPFRPHITLIRRSSFRGDNRIPVEIISDCGMTVKRVSLMKSERGKSGMIYTEIGYIEG